ncbi:MAG: PorT family protein [Bacteroidales bacterium]|nr:PorT family protein [Bacteroidales bacterium]
MKKNLLFVIALLIAGASHAQLPLNLGIKFGYNPSRITTNMSDIKDDIHNGFHAGAFMRINIKKLYIQPELCYTLKGGELTYDSEVLNPNDPGKSIKQTIKLQTVDIPVLLGVKIIDPPVMNLRLFAGPVGSLILNKDLKLSISGVDQDAEGIDETLKDMIWGVQMGAGVDVLMFTLDFRYELGLNNLYDKPEDASHDLSEYKSNVFLISLGWKIL